MNIPSDLSIRRARDGDLPQMARLHRTCFPEMELNLDATMEHLRNTPRLSMEDNWICEKTGEMVGMFALYPFQMYLGGTTYPTGGIGRVAIAPQARRSKLAYWMMLKAVQIMDQNSTPFSFLHPFLHGFYRYLGWGFVGRVKCYNFNTQFLPDFDERSGVFPVETYQQQEAVMECYREFAEEHNCLMHRDDQSWIEQRFKSYHAYAYNNPGTEKVEGYILYKYDILPVNSAPFESDIDVYELVWNTRSAFRGLLGFLAAQRDQVRAVHYSDHLGLNLEYLLKEPLRFGGEKNMLKGAENSVNCSAIMGRIVQLRRALKIPNYLGKGSGKITLKISDKFSPENTEPIAVEFENGQANFVRDAAEGVTLSTDIATFSSLYFGSISIKEALYLDLVELSGKGDASFLVDVFPTTKPICLEYF